MSRRPSSVTEPVDTAANELAEKQERLTAALLAGENTGAIRGEIAELEAAATARRSAAARARAAAERALAERIAAAGDAKAEASRVALANCLAELQVPSFPLIPGL